MVVNERVRFTREELYELVWSRPLTDIAAEFGMSSGAFAKHCKKANVPCPGRGHWQLIAAGHSAQRERLPPPGPRPARDVIITRYAEPARLARAPKAVAGIEVRKGQRPHAVAKELDELLHDDARHQDMLAVRGSYEVVLKVSKTTRVRARQLLTALFFAIEARGHAIRLRALERNVTQWTPRAVEVVIDGEVLRVSLAEHLDRRDHVPSGYEKEFPIFAKRYDLVPSGRLRLELHVPWPTHTRTKWRDGDEQHLEDVLGEIVGAIDEAAAALVVHRARVAEQERRAEIERKLAAERELERQRVAEEERRRKEAAARAAAHQKALVDDLVGMATAWSTADTVRAFLAAVEARVPVAERSEGFDAWLAWARTQVRALDPLESPERIAKHLEPAEPPMTPPVTGRWVNHTA